MSLRWQCFSAWHFFERAEQGWPASCFRFSGLLCTFLTGASSAA
ncbi:hypothetical protein CSC28_2176 [Pseudomonas paraeruginosa]|nr:hypothetical protein CSC28_2176 [Pseudomonas paraeruginosa]